ncbi:MAG: hypothetical protein M3Y08_04085 [Fibrobacterota bacterium]|nr:hypothetical protein [Fibrobacterota bacterium]
MTDSMSFDPEFGCGKKSPWGAGRTPSSDIISFPMAPGKSVVIPNVIMGGMDFQLKENQAVGVGVRSEFGTGTKKE